MLSVQSSKRYNHIDKSRIKLLDCLSFLVPFSSFIKMDIIGRLYLTDILLLCLLPYLFAKRGKRLFSKLPITTIILLIFWLIFQIISDLINESDFHNFVRGWAMIIFTLINFSALYLLLHGNTKRLITYAVGLASGEIIGYLISPTSYSIAHPWKFGYGHSITLLLIIGTILINQKQKIFRYWPSVGMFIVSTINLIMGTRAVSGVTFLSGCYMVFSERNRSNKRNIKNNIKQLMLIAFLMIAGAWGVISIYKYTVLNGYLGQKALQKYEMQAYGKYGLVLGGRSEVLVSGLAVLDSPVIGHGSWAKDCRYASLYTDIKKHEGYDSGENYQDCLIPTHSHLMGAWVQAGVFGAIFWLWIFTLPCRCLMNTFNKYSKLTPLVVYAAFMLIWDILFSPYGAERRFITPYYIVLMISFLPINTNIAQSSTRIKYSIFK